MIGYNKIKITRTKYSFYFCCNTTYCIVIYSTTYSQEMEQEKRIKKYHYFSKLRKIKNMENAGMSIWGGKGTGGFGVSRNVSQ